MSDNDNDNLKNLKPGITHKLSDISDETAKSELLALFDRKEGYRRLSVEAGREAMLRTAEAKISQAKAETVMAQTQQAEIAFMIRAGNEFDEINTEPVWQVRKARTKDGALDVIFECLMTENDIQNYHSKRASIIRQQSGGGNDQDLENLLGGGDQ
jgi:hypothetical protein